MENGKRIIAFLTSRDSRNKRMWLGIYYFTIEALQKHCGDISCLGPVNPKLPKLKAKSLRLIDKFSRKLLKKKYNCKQSIFVAQTFSKKFETKLLEKEFDLISALAASTEAAILKNKIPMKEMILQNIRAYVTCSAEFWGGEEPDFRPAVLLRNSCRSSDSHCIQLVDDPTDADVVLFAEYHGWEARSGHFLERVRQTPVYRKFGFKTAVHSGQDLPFPIIPGIYPSLTRTWATGLQCVGGPYIVDPNPFLNQDVGWDGEIRWLAAFQGCCNDKPLRLHLLDLNSPQIQIIACDDEFLGAIRENDKEKMVSLKRGFVRQMLESKFVLCPRGYGASSFRIFEAMQLSRVPVIIADGWLPPPGPCWNEFAIFVCEKELIHLADILKSREQEWEQMRHLAREMWEKFYSPTRLGDTVLLSAFQAVNTSRVKQFSHRTIAQLQFFRYDHLRLWVRQSRDQLLATIK